MSSVARLRRVKGEGHKVWRVRPAWERCGELARGLRAPELAGQLLYNRGVCTVEAGRSFLQPNLNDLADPWQLPGMKAAVDRIHRAVERGEQIVIYGDYDVDGITSVAILWQCFRLAGVEVGFYVPHRLEEGYGLNIESIRTLAGQGAKLIITVDCGITGHECAEEAARLGVDVVITDHHKVEGSLPRAVAVVHPDLPGENYPCRNLCGAGVAFKLAWALAQACSGSQRVRPEFREFLVSATGLAALGTIADVVDLVGENRVISHFGLTGLAASGNLGIKALIEAAGLTGAALSSADIGFKLAPRLNAAGRMGHARLAVELLTRASAERARQIADYLEGQNRLRQKVEKEIAEQAGEQVKALGMDGEGYRAIVVASEQWHGGVIGIVASRLVDRFGKPAIVISLEGERAMGSCRSVAGFDMVGALEACGEWLSGFGGHAMAAGLTLEAGRVDEFREAFNRHALAVLVAEAGEAVLDIDAEVELGQLTLATMGLVERLGPFGAGNPSVRLAARGLRLAGPIRRIGQKGDHLQLALAAGDDPDPTGRPGGVMRAVAFGKGKWEKKLADAGRFDVAFEPVINRFNGRETVEMMIEEIDLEGQGGCG